MRNLFPLNYNLTENKIKMINREYEYLIKRDFFKGKVIIITGARQVGKTTIVKSIIESKGVDNLYLNGDESDIHSLFEKPCKQLFVS